ncbi:MAG: hypothetical protein ABGW69_04025 [Nanoarchaeota archaeon]
MFTFIVYSDNAWSSPSFKDLTQGRIDILIHSIIHSLFVSEKIRADVELNLFLAGPPDPIKHIQIIPKKETPFSKKDLATLLRIALGKYKPGKKVEALPGVFIEKKGLIEFLQEKFKKNKDSKLFILDVKGEDIVNYLNEGKINENSIFLVGDHEGLNKKLVKSLKKFNPYFISLSDVVYFTSQTLTILNFLLDREFERKFIEQD